MFNNYSDLDNFEFGFYHALDTSVRDNTVGDNAEHTQTDREIDSQVHLVGQSIYSM